MDESNFVNGGPIIIGTYNQNLEQSSSNLFDYNNNSNDEEYPPFPLPTKRKASDALHDDVLTAMKTEHKVKIEDDLLPFSRKMCQVFECGKFSQGGTLLCITHGGGKRCTVEGCTKAARGKLFCSAHGGGKRCNEAGCSHGAVGGSNKCIAHGGGKRCIFEGCTKSMQPGTVYCSKHRYVKNED
eukprot:gene31613-39053_t